MLGHSARGWLHKRIAASYRPHRVAALQPQPIISFTFDDFPRSALHHAAPVLERRGACGTFYASLELAGRDSVVGPIFTHEDLASILHHGHELACHTYSHLSALEHPAEIIAQSCAENRRRVLDLFPDHLLRNFSYPFGDVTLAAKKRLGDVYSTCRTVQPGINNGSVDLAYLRANPLYSAYPFQHVRSLIDRNSAARGWLIFYTHDVCDAPSRYGCTPAYFQNAVDYASQSGARLLPIRHAVAHYQEIPAPACAAL